ncbi:hypothetical protein D5R93_11370 [Actinomyces lilanjuaniae]|uniref:Uncharacterized protein n=1 Tax=Actinomyces lilanjuaniae TaxID=2321394 RepID=A0ABN5PQA4_9ACTO|nr:hypothetical protein D5R93_11370 [Actinomyces lilanjuaniae]
MSAPSGSPRRHRRVVVLSPGDRDRVAHGEVPEDLAQADSTAEALRSVATRGESAPGSTCGSGGADRADSVVSPDCDNTNDARLLRDVPPHW